MKNKRSSYDSQTILCNSRSSLEHSCHASVDQTLKRLKLDTRRLQLSLDALSEEAQILERLYYKGKNQHRGALFWRRVSEMRRYFDRVQRENILGTASIFRCSFFGPNATQNPALLKGSWTHVPLAPSLKVLLADLTAYSKLMEKMCEQIIEAYRSFTISMQNGAFLQFLLALVAIASRVRILASEILNCLRLIVDSGVKILAIIERGSIDEKDRCMVIDEQQLRHDLVLEAVDTQDSDINNAGAEDASGLDESVLQHVIKKEHILVQPNNENNDKKKAQAASQTRKTKKKKVFDEIDSIFGS